MERLRSQSKRVACNRDRRVGDPIHTASRNGVNHCALFIAQTPVWIESGEVQGWIARRYERDAATGAEASRNRRVTY